MSEGHRGSRAQVTLKVATSLDGRIATASGESQWITSAASREEVHRLRAEHHAVLVGSGTVLADDPMLTVRLGGYEGRQPLRVVVDGRGRTPLTANVVRTAQTYGELETGSGAAWWTVHAMTPPWDRRADGVAPTLIIRSEEARGPQTWADVKVDRYFAAGCAIGFAGPSAQGGLAPGEVLGQIDKALGRLHQLEVPGYGGDGALFLEGGGTLAASFLREDLIDRIEWFRAPIVLGAEGKPALGELGLPRLGDAPRFERTAIRELGSDIWESYVRRGDLDG